MTRPSAAWWRNARPWQVWLVIVLVWSVFAPAGAQETTTYSAGQNVVPAYEGWEENADGSFNLVFGYYNRNWDEAIDVPIGPDNTIEPGNPDQGQPTHFLPRRNLFVFRVRVPKDFGKKEVVWTLKSKGKTERAYATLIPEYFIDDSVITANNGAAGGGAGTLELQNLNKAPKLRLEGEPVRSTVVGQPVALSAFASDDDIPKRRSMAPRQPFQPTGAAISSATGLRLAWFVYRGAGRVVFDPPQFKVYMDTRNNSPWTPGWAPPPIPHGGKWDVTATFTEPGAYVLRCLAHDGALATFQDVTVTVVR